MPQNRMRWAELLDVLTDSDRKREVVLERATETERMALFLLRREAWSALVSPKDAARNRFAASLHQPGGMRHPVFKTASLPGLSSFRRLKGTARF